MEDVAIGDKLQGLCSGKCQVRPKKFEAERKESGSSAGQAF